MGEISSAGGTINSLQVSRGFSINTSVADVDLPGGSLLFVGTGGDIVVDLKDIGTGLTFKNIADGTFLPLWVKKVYNTGTTATDIISIN